MILGISTGETSMDISSALAENPEISLTIRKLHENYKTGLITNSTKQLTEQILRKIGVDPKHFDVVITSDVRTKTQTIVRTLSVCF